MHFFITTKLTTSILKKVAVLHALVVPALRKKFSSSVTLCANFCKLYVFLG